MPLEGLKAWIPLGGETLLSAPFLLELFIHPGKGSGVLGRNKIIPILIVSKEISAS
jgi:hypothetical protein